MESPLRGDMHGGFGERPGETDQQQCRHRAPGRLIRMTVKRKAAVRPMLESIAVPYAERQVELGRAWDLPEV